MTFMSRITNGLTGAMQSVGTMTNIVPMSPTLDADTLRGSPHALYSLLRALSINTNAYRTMQPYLADYGLESVSLHGLRNPVNAVASVYESLLWPGTIREDNDASALPLAAPANLTTIDGLFAATHRVWRESNFSNRKEMIAYDSALLGEQIYRVVGEPDRQRAYFEVVQPDFVTDLDTDGRGYLTYIRIDIPQLERLANGERRRSWHTEEWRKDGAYRVWRHEHNPNVGTDLLGTPVEDMDIEQMYGTDFVPFVHYKHRESSASPRGMSSVIHALDKIVYLDALATALHERLTNHNIPDKVLSSNLVDEAGMPVKAPKLGDANKLEINGSMLWALPGGWSLTDTVAQLDYMSHLAVVNSHYEAIAETDLPELNWYTIGQSGNDQSGTALQVKLTPVINKVEKARGRAESELIRITQMVMTVGQNLGIPEYSAERIGSYERGDFDFWIQDRPIVPLTQNELLDLDAKRATTLRELTDAGVAIDVAARIAGYSEDDAEAMLRGDSVDGLLP